MCSEAVCITAAGSQIQTTGRKLEISPHSCPPPVPKLPATVVTAFRHPLLSHTHTCCTDDNDMPRPLTARVEDRRREETGYHRVGWVRERSGCYIPTASREKLCEKRAALMKALCDDYSQGDYNYSPCCD